ncbi:LexA family transcriptional regulator [Bacterioplanes sanyensis]|uniref:LexA regulated protein n=1 Tax=Bacterioplanes sanyensis TaxID=1249553 RepID=UPI00167A1017|nr:LexA regulated protein [Bacterioplanes sanyensis]GGY40654.1 LexA family transcriptional regulator [Bacterioplanes sanyensis]
MSVQPEDRTTIDMFAARRRGRPRSNPYDRSLQCRVNKRSQRQRDKARGLKRLEVKVPHAIVEHLDDACEQLQLNRAEVMELALRHWLHLGDD